MPSITPSEHEALIDEMEGMAAKLLGRLSSASDRFEFCGEWQQTATVLCPKSKLCVQARIRDPQLAFTDEIQQHLWAEEFLPWFQLQLPEMLAPIALIETEKYWLSVSPVIKILNPENQKQRTDAYEKCATIQRALSHYGLYADLNEATNLGYVQGGKALLIYDMGALRFLDRNKSQMSHEEFNHMQIPHVSDANQLRPQIDLWKNRRYPLRKIADLVQQFADTHDGMKTLLLPNPGIIKPPHHAVLTL